MIHEGQLEVFDLTLTAKAPVFIGSGKSYVKKEYVFLTPRFARVSCDEVMLLDETKFFHLLLERKLEDKYTQFMLGAQTDLYRFLTAECCLSLNDIRAARERSAPAADFVSPGCGTKHSGDCSPSKTRWSACQVHHGTTCAGYS